MRKMCSYYLTPLEKKQAVLVQKNNSLLLGLYARADIGIHYDGWSFRIRLNFSRSMAFKIKKR